MGVRGHIQAAAAAAKRTAAVRSTSSQGDDNNKAAQRQEAPSASEMDQEDNDAQSDQGAALCSVVADPKPASSPDRRFSSATAGSRADTNETDGNGESIRWFDVAVLVALCLLAFLVWMAAHTGTRAVATRGRNLTFGAGAVIVALVAVAILSCLLVAAVSCLVSAETTATASASSSPSTKARICRRFAGGGRTGEAEQKGQRGQHVGVGRIG